MQQPRVLRLDGRVALAGGLDQAFHVGDFDMSAAVVDEVCLLQCVGHQRNAVARAPIIWAIASWVRTSLSLPERSRVCSRIAPAGTPPCARHCSRPSAGFAHRRRGRAASARYATWRSGPRHYATDRDRSSRRRRAPAPRRYSAQRRRRARRMHRKCCRGRSSRSGHARRAEFDDQRDDALVRGYARLSVSSTSTSTMSGLRSAARRCGRTSSKSSRSARTKIHSENEGLNPKQSLPYGPSRSLASNACYPKCKMILAHFIGKKKWQIDARGRQRFADHLRRGIRGVGGDALLSDNPARTTQRGSTGCDALHAAGCEACISGGCLSASCVFEMRCVAWRSKICTDGGRAGATTAALVRTVRR